MGVTINPARAYRIGFDVPFEPFGLLDQGRPTGMLVELVRMLLERAGIAHTFETMPLAETEGALFSGRVDALAFKGVTAPRLSTMTFSEPLIVSGGATFTRPELEPSTDLAVYAGKTIVTPRKGPLWAHIAANYPALRLVDGDSYEGSFTLLASGEADVAALNLHAGIAIARRLFPDQFRLPNAPYTALPIAFAIAKDADGTKGAMDAQGSQRAKPGEKVRPAELIGAINTQLKASHENGSYQRIHDEWLRG